MDNIKRREDEAKATEIKAKMAEINNAAVETTTQGTSGEEDKTNDGTESDVGAESEKSKQ